MKMLAVIAPRSHLAPQNRCACSRIASNTGPTSPDDVDGVHHLASAAPGQRRVAVGAVFVELASKFRVGALKIGYRRRASGSYAHSLAPCENDRRTPPPSDTCRTLRVAKVRLAATRRDELTILDGTMG